MAEQSPNGALADLDMERAVIDACIAAPPALAAVRPVLDARAFYWTQHRTIYRAALALADQGVVVDLLTVRAALEEASPPKHGESWSVTLAGILGAAPTYTGAARYAARVVELARLRRLASLGALLSASPDDTELQDQIVDAVRSAAHTAAPVVVATPLDAFLAQETVLPPALIGTTDDVLLPAGGLLIEYAKGGRGKTTLTVDLAYHAVSGVDWLGFAIPRPLRVLFIENEGPSAMFRRKLDRKGRHWPHPIRGALYVLTEPWGRFSFADRSHVEQLRAVVEREAIDVVIGDPLDTLGLAGVGSPENTRDFLAMLNRVGLTQDVAFVLLHHPRKEVTADELDEAAGAWGGRPDTMLRLARLPGNRARLSFPKFRWTERSEHLPLILGFEPDDDSFSVLAVETPTLDEAERDLLAELRALLADGQWRTPREIGAPANKGGIGARREAIEELLAAHPELFAESPGSLVGRGRCPVVWKART